MSLIKCSECGKQISSKASNCQNCGAPIKKSNIGYLSIIVIIIMAFFLCDSIHSCHKKSKAIKKRELVKIQKENEKANFENSIEKHYKNMVEEIYVSNYDEAKTLINQFIRYNQLKYKNVSTIKNEIELALLEREAMAIPEANLIEKLEIYKKLAILDPTSDWYMEKVAYYYDKSNKNAEIGEKITITTIGTRARLCPYINCRENEHITRIPEKTTLVVSDVIEDKLPLWSVKWFEVTYKGKKGWVSIFNTDKQ